MSKLTNVRVEYIIDATINVGNFQNVKPGFRVSADVPEDMHPTEAKNKLKALVDPWMEEEIDHHRSEAGS